MTLTLSERRNAFKDSSLTTDRAGYPLPNTTWYRNPNKQGDHVPMTFSKENFVQGFDLTCGEYYILRDALVPLLRKDDLYKKKFNDPNIDYDHLWPIFEKISKHALLQHPAHVGWKHHMLFRWITVTAEWIKALEKKDSDNKSFAFLPPENWKWGRSDLSPKKRAPYTLYKHVSIRVEDEEGDAAIIRVADLVDEEVRPSMGNMIDLTLSEIRFENLVNILNENRFIAYKQSNKIEFLHALRGNVYVAIENDKQLAYAIQQLRVRGTSKVEMRTK